MISQYSKDFARRILANKTYLRAFQQTQARAFASAQKESYEEHQRLALDPKTREEFWAKQAEELTWFKKYDKVLDDSKAPLYRWFTGGQTNLSYNCIDRHVDAGRGKDIAVHYESAFSKTTRTMTYKGLQIKVSKFAKILTNQGVKKGDTVIIYMPMIPEALIAMHACVRIGAIHSVVFGGFAPDELAHRIHQARPKIIITASCGHQPKGVIPYVPFVDKALQLAGEPEMKRIIVQRGSYREEKIDKNVYIDYHEEMEKIQRGQDVVPVEGEHPFFILYTSGTTGNPKGIYRSVGGSQVGWNYSMKYIFDINQKDVMFATSDIGWIVGHKFIIYAPLLRGGTTVLYDGKPSGTPNSGIVWRMIEDYGVKSLFIAPTGVRGIKQEDHDGEYIKEYDLKTLESIHLAGERCDPETFKWLQHQFPKLHVNDNWWQTETGWPISSNYINLTTFPQKPGSATKPSIGWDVVTIDDEDQPFKEAQKIGKIMVKLPCPPCHMDGLWGNDPAYVEKYLSSPEGYYMTGDAGYFDEEGYLYVMTRTDDVINTAGHRISTGRIEEVLLEHHDVAECAVVGQEESLKGVVPFAYVVVYSNNHDEHAAIIKDIQNQVRVKIGAFAKLGNVLFVPKLPKTRSGKILRNLLRDISNGIENPRINATIEDASIVPEIIEIYQNSIKEDD